MYTQENRKTMDHVNKKWVKVITVITYVISVSIVALVLGLYYKLAWNPKYDLDNPNVLNSDNTSDIGIFELKLGTINIKPTNNKSASPNEVKSILSKILTSILNKEDSSFVFIPYETDHHRHRMDSGEIKKEKSYSYSIKIKVNRNK